MATYASQSDFEAYVEGWTTSDAAALERVLLRAERDIDNLLPPPGPRVVSTLLKYDPATLDAFTAQQLKYAVCAQAEYRITMTEDFFKRPQYAKASGPDFSTDGKLPRIGPKALFELKQAEDIWSIWRRSSP